VLRLKEICKSIIICVESFLKTLFLICSDVETLEKLEKTLVTFSYVPENMGKAQTRAHQIWK
jgi:hypothetical protein